MIGWVIFVALCALMVFVVALGATFNKRLLWSFGGGAVIFGFLILSEVSLLGFFLLGVPYALAGLTVGVARVWFQIKNLGTGSLLDILTVIPRATVWPLELVALVLSLVGVNVDFTGRLKGVLSKPLFGSK